MDLTVLWFGLVVFFWAGYLLLEGFDFGVGILAFFAPEERREETLETIGPHWDGNEVWLVVAVGAMFAAFPGWYADLLSANYLALLVVLVALIVRGIALEFRSKGSTPRWRSRCDLGIFAGSLLPPIVWGSLLTGSTVGGPVLLALCVAHGWAFLALKARRVAIPFLVTTVVVGVGAVATMMLRFPVSELRPDAAGEYGLRVMTWASLAILPVVIGYQAWSYRVFARRVAP